MKHKYNERMVEIRENGIFIDDMIDLLESDDFSFLEHFQSNILRGVFTLCKLHSTERS